MTNAIHSGDEPRPFFFLSYARSRFRPDNGSDPDRWVAKLYGDLCHDVGVVTGTSVPGFMDRQIPVGTQWPEHLAEALAGCRVFIALLSPAYFTSEYCGKEWAAFVERASSGDPRHSAIIPALWTRMGDEELPESLRSMQYTAPEFPAPYTTEGFYGIMKLGRYREHYKQTVLQLARIIKETAAATNLPTGTIPDFDSLANPFADHQREVHKPIRLTVAAHRLDRLPPPRDAYYYGRTMTEWTPYRSPINMTPIAVQAEQMLANLGHEPIVESIDAPGEITDAPVVLLVDPWVVRDPAIGNRLRQLDEVPVNVLAPFNSDDAQTVEDDADLKTGLREVLGRSQELNGSDGHVPDDRAFRAALPKAAAEATARYFRTAKVHPPTTAPTMPTRPTLQTPEL